MERIRDRRDGLDRHTGTLALDLADKLAREPGRTSELLLRQTPLHAIEPHPRRKLSTQVRGERSLRSAPPHESAQSKKRVSLCGQRLLYELIRLSLHTRAGGCGAFADTLALFDEHGASLTADLVDGAGKTPLHLRGSGTSAQVEIAHEHGSASRELGVGLVAFANAEGDAHRHE